MYPCYQNCGRCIGNPKKVNFSPAWNRAIKDGGIVLKDSVSAQKCKGKSNEL
jgi:hypothetical protein